MTSNILVEAYIIAGSDIFKNLIELLWRITPIKQISKQAIFKINKKGIFININYQGLILTDVALSSSNFTLFNYNCENISEFNIGICLNPLKEFFSDVQKGKNVVFRVNKEEGQIIPSKVEICITGDNCSTSSKGYTINISNEQNIEIIASIDAEKLITTITSNEFTSLCKCMGSKNHLVSIKSNDSSIVFSKSQIPGMDVSWLTFKANKEQVKQFSNHIKSEYIKNIIKLASFNSKIQIFTSHDDGYIIFKSTITRNLPKKVVEPLGIISIWIKTEPKQSCNLFLEDNIEY
ncbi:hypothetical protein AGMMS49579_22140 [Spirochaetia bacterium]|nr:hypothetical protein AGMMS49579_22140 [Spirochaetia bacterium]